MAVILALDVSTSCTGVCIIDSSVAPDGEGGGILLLDRIEFKKCKTLWEKADAVEMYLSALPAESSLATRVSRIVLEEPLMRFAPGLSSAATISSLLRFNGIASYVARRVFGCEPEYVSAAHARKLCGVKMQKTAVAGTQKAQVFKHMAASDLKHVKWPLKKSGDPADWSGDATDAYVIARAAAIAGPIAPTKKPKKSKKLLA